MKETTSIEILKCRKGVRVNTITNTIMVNRNPANGGLGLWKHLDFLTNYCNYTVIFT